MDGYEGALEAAGAEVLSFKEFGSYQGDWYAKVNYDGRTGWVRGSYGSCSYCDAFQSEFDYSGDACSEHKYTYNDDIKAKCVDCAEAKKVYRERLAEFGKRYLDNLLSQEDALAEANRNIEWDLDAKSMVDYLQANAIPE